MLKNGINVITAEERVLFYDLILSTLEEVRKVSKKKIELSSLDLLRNWIMGKFDVIGYYSQVSGDLEIYSEFYGERIHETFGKQVLIYFEPANSIQWININPEQIKIRKKGKRNV